jgi:spermidine synthase
MKKRTTIATALTPDGETVSLIEQDGCYSIRVGGIELMSTRRHASEDKIAELACAHAAEIRGARVLIGGLGCGFTLKAALATLAADATVIVAEIMAAVVTWNRNPAFPLAGAVMADPRVTVLNRDVGDVIRESAGGLDAIMLDVDNGPAALCADGNSRLYDPQGLRLTRAALRRGGCVTYWSVTPDPAFERSLARAGFAVEALRCRAHTNSGSWHTIFVGRVTQP